MVEREVLGLGFRPQLRMAVGALTERQSQVKGAPTIATRKMESEHERSLLIVFPSLEDGTLSTTWANGHFLHFGAVSKPPELLVKTAGRRGG